MLREKYRKQLMGLFRAEFFRITLQAKSIVAADRSAAPSALPLGFFFFQKFRHAVFFDEGQVVNHTHPVFGPVALIQILQAPTGKIAAVVAEMNEAVS